MIEKIYSFVAVGGGCCVSGRVCATDMADATDQVMNEIDGYGQMNVKVSELRNQARALREWNEKHRSHKQGSKDGAA